MDSIPAADGTQASIPALMRAARGSYALVISAHLAAAGLDDLPRNGPFVLGGMARWGGSASDMTRALGVTKQAASQLVDTLVLRGYLTREVNPSDRRRMTIDLTDRGREAAAAVGAAVAEVDARLAEMISPGQLAGLRAGLAALAAIKDEAEGA
jgi:DNA-binding MarR family transcriptional regulator